MNEIQKFITSYQDISELNNHIHEIKQSVRDFEKDVLKRVIEIRKIRSKIYNNSCTGRVDSVCYINNSDIIFDVSYCGCCENNREELEVDLLLMDDENVEDFFIKQKKISDDERLEIKKKKESEDKIMLEQYERKEYARLKKKLSNKEKE